MDKNILYKYFAGNATPEEKETLKNWLDEDAAHQQELIRERQFFNAVIMADEYKEESKPARVIKYYPVIKEFVKIAAIVTLVLLGAMRFHSKEIEKIAHTENVITVPPGQRVNLKLPDSTTVWLNAGSKFTYPAYFTNDTREVELEGEAFFEVSENKKKPFIVRTALCDVEVLGTSFNVEAYTSKGIFSAALLTGSIKITERLAQDNHSLILKPGRQVRMKYGKLEESPITDFEYYRWQEGLICFRDMQFTELMQRFEKCYDVQIVIQNPDVSDIRFNGKFRISDGIDNALRILQRDARYNYEKNSDGTVIYIK